MEPGATATGYVRVDTFRRGWCNPALDIIAVHSDSIMSWFVYDLSASTGVYSCIVPLDCQISFFRVTFVLKNLEDVIE